MSKFLVFFALLLMLALTGLSLWIRSQLRIVQHAINIHPGGKARMSLRLDPRDSVAEWRGLVYKAVAADLPEPSEAGPGSSLFVSLQLEIRRREMKLGWPPWADRAHVEFSIPYGLLFDSGLPPGWISANPQDGLNVPMPRERALVALMDLITRQLEKNRTELDRY